MGVSGSDDMEDKIIGKKAMESLRPADGWIFWIDIKVTQHGDKNNAEEKDNKPGMKGGDPEMSGNCNKEEEWID